jgi:hypothetical protein
MLATEQLDPHAFRMMNVTRTLVRLRTLALVRQASVLVIAIQASDAMKALCAIPQENMAKLAVC